MVHEDFVAAMQIESAVELQKAIVGFANRLDFQTVDAIAVVDRFGGESEFIGVTNAPPTYREISMNLGAAHRDPVMQHCKRNSVPIVWNQDIYVRAGQGELWEEQAAFGYRTGIIVAMHLPDGLHFCLGVDREQPLPKDDIQLTRMAAEVQLFAVYAQEAAFRVLLPPAPQSDIPTLTSRELESLRWTMEGKTAWELGRILTISEQTAVKHLNNAAHKLGCTSKHQAVLKALRLGLIR